MAASSDEQFIFIKKRMRDYFARLAWVSEQWTPPGKNAANGNWPNNTVGDAELQSTEAQPTIELDGDGQKIYSIFSQFQSGIRQALSTSNAEAGVWSNLPLFLDVFKDGLEVFINVFVDIYKIFSDNKVKQEEAKKVLLDDIKALIQKIEDNGMVENGDHANGHISRIVRDHANVAITSLDRDFPTGGASKFQNLADALRIVCTNLTALNTENHKPWLRPEWQVSYQAITKAASVALEA